MTFIKFSSIDRTLQTDSTQDFKVEIPQHVRGHKFKLSYAYIPISWYTINDTNNKIYFEETEGVVLTGTIVNGNYTNTTLPTAIKTVMESIGVNTYNIDISSTTNKMRIYTTDALDYRFYNNTDKSLYPNSIHKVIGFDSETLDVFADSDRTGYDMVNLNCIDSLNIRLGDVLNVETLKYFGTSLIIPVNGNSLDYINYEPFTFNQTITFPKTTNTLVVQVRDQNYNLIDLNGINWFVVLEKMDMM